MTFVDSVPKPDPTHVKSVCKYMGHHTMTRMCVVLSHLGHLCQLVSVAAPQSLLECPASFSPAPLPSLLDLLLSPLGTAACDSVARDCQCHPLVRSLCDSCDSGADSLTTSGCDPSGCDPDGSVVPPTPVRTLHLQGKH